MPLLGADGVIRDIDVVVLDKDGTLIDFHAQWWGRLERGIDAVAALGQSHLGPSAGAASTGPAADLRRQLFRTLGADPQTRAILPDSPYASTTIAKTGTIAAVVLHQAGIAWSQAEAIVAEALLPALTALPQPAEIVPLGDVAGWMAALAASGVRLAIATNDERAVTEATLHLAGLRPAISTIVCADDGHAPKPAPDGLLHIARLLGVPPGRLAMVGDSASDMRAGRAAGAGLVVGVLSGTGRRGDLEALADVVVADIHAIGVA